jgi:mannose-6-phosphate isomerase-like protein (cupin superfamily)
MTHHPQLPFGTSVALTEAIAVEQALLPPGAPIGMSRFSVPAGQATPVDRHRPIELWLIRAGRGELSYEGRQMHIESGDMIYLASNASHSVHNYGPGSLDIFSIWFLDESSEPEASASERHRDLT